VHMYVSRAGSLSLSLSRTRAHTAIQRICILGNVMLYCLYLYIYIYIHISLICLPSYSRLNKKLVMVDL
jgi:hypothetical protein